MYCSPSTSLTRLHCVRLVGLCGLDENVAASAQDAAENGAWSGSKAKDAFFSFTFVQLFKNQFDYLKKVQAVSLI
jgi:hypothetical protein